MLINTILPIKYLYFKSVGQSCQDELFEIINKIKSEKNSIIDSFNNIGVHSKSAFDSQSLIHLFNNYCKPKKCLSCVMGNELLK